MQGFSPAVEWCDRRLLARIHRYTLNRLRAEIEPVSPADLMRFLFAWQHVDPSSRLAGIDGLRAALESLDGFELAADAWERAILPDRVDGYQPSMLDTLCLTGEVGWARLTSSPRDATQLLPNPLDVPAMLPATAGTARRRQVGHDLAGGDVALDRAQRQPERLGELRGADELRA